MEREAPDAASVRKFTHKAVCPVDVEAVRAACNILCAVDVDRGADRCILDILSCILLRCHVSAAAPVLVTDAEIRNIKRSHMTVFGTFCGKGRGTFGHIQVFHEIAHIHRCLCGDVCCDIRLCSDHLTKVHELVCTDRIGLNTVVIVVPPVCSLRTLFSRTYAVAPVIGLRKAAARPAEDRRVDRFEFLDDEFTESVDVLHIGLRTDPKTVIVNTADVLGKMSVDLGCDGAAAFTAKKTDFFHMVILPFVIVP